MSAATQLEGRTCLVIGGRGFIGRHLCSRLAAGGARVLCTGRSVDLRSGVKALPAAGQVLEQRLEPADPQQVQALLAASRPELLFFLAADIQLERRVELLRPQIDAHVVSAGVVLEATIQARVPRIVWTGTCEEYGDGPAPFREDQALRPVSPYSATRAAASLMAWTLARTCGARIVVVRPFLTYGPGQKGDRFIPQAFAAALAAAPFPMTPGEQTRDLIYVRDVVDGLLAAALTPGIEGEIFNLCTGTEVTIKTLAEHIFALVGADPRLIQAGALPYRAGEAMRFFGDPTRARVGMNFLARVSLQEGLALTAQALTAQALQNSSAPSGATVGPGASSPVPPQHRSTSS